MSFHNVPSLQDEEPKVPAEIIEAEEDLFESDPDDEDDEDDDEDDEEEEDTEIV